MVAPLPPGVEVNCLLSANVCVLLKMTDVEWIRTVDAAVQPAQVIDGVATSRFVRAKEAAWLRLSELLDRCQRRGVGGLTGEELVELGRLYRRAAADLAYVRTHLADPELAGRLNQLVARAHGVVYVSEGGGWRSIPRFFWREFPETLWQARRYVLVVALLLLGAGLLAYVSAALHTPFGEGIPPRDYLLPMDRGSAQFRPGPSVLGFVTTNNIGVAFRAFAGGVTAGAFTVVAIVANGLMLGKIAAIMAGKGQAVRFWAAILPHGVLELSAIVIAGAAGLVIGWSIIAPGDLSRRRAVAVAGARAVRMVIGTVPMFVLAGTIEGLLSFTNVPAAVKLSVAAMSAVVLAVYVSRKPSVHAAVEKEVR
jgi:uncharacterized membrane protein SpoIIM required for sporulation